MVLLVLGELFSLEEEEGHWQVLLKRRRGTRAHRPVPGLAHLLTLAVRSSRSPSMALGETSKVATKVT